MSKQKPYISRGRTQKIRNFLSLEKRQNDLETPEHQRYRTENEADPGKKIALCLLLLCQ